MEKPFRDTPDGSLTPLELIETFRYAPQGGFVRGARHLARMAASAEALGLPFDAEAAQAVLAPVGGSVPLRVRLVLGTAGAFQVTTAPLLPTASAWTCAISDTRLDAEDPWLRHKTNRRALYDRARAALPAGVDEMLFLNRDGALCEGTITNIFLRDGTRLLTPPLAAGLLPGVLRGQLLAEGRAEEADLGIADLAGASALYVGNSLRGLIPARLEGAGD